MTAFAERLNQARFDGRLAPAVLELLARLDDQPGAQPLVERAAAHMAAARFPATAFNGLLALQLVDIAEHLLPVLAQGFVPTTTFAGRHADLDELLADRLHDRPSGTLLDVGCGFPPLTTVELARRLPAWQVIGTDLSFPALAILDGHGSSAVFDAEGRLRSVHFDHERVRAAPYDRETAAAHFSAQRELLLPRLPAAEREVELHGTRLLRDPVASYAAGNLSFATARIGDRHLPTVQALRCLNVLSYFDGETRRAAREWMAGRLDEGGVCLVGTNYTGGCEARYRWYRRAPQGLVPEEFGFSLDNLRPLGFLPWVDLPGDDDEVATLAGLVGAVRADHNFAESFDRRLDELLGDSGLARRRADGSLEVLSHDVERIGPALREAGLELGRDGYGRRAAEILVAAGYEARADGGQVGVRTGDATINGTGRPRGR